jgi:F-box protein 18 (helicase)
LNLYNGDKKNIRDVLIRNMRDIVELEDYIEKTEDVQLGMMLEIVKEYGNRIPSIIKSIKDKHVENSERENAEIIFSTVHRCKGLEYDVVQLVDDFLTEDKLEKQLASGDKSEYQLSRLNEEINLLYVAVTRARNQLIIPLDLLPYEIPASYRIRVIRPELEEKDSPKSGKNGQKAKPSTSNKSNKNENSPSKANSPWTEYLDEELTTLYLRGECVEDLSAYFSRTPSAIKMRLKKLGLDD